jgi:competence protein ComFB
MAKRDNKTEHVMKLITKDGAASLGASGNEDADAVMIETEVRQTDAPPPSYKTKLKIEIEPEIEVKDPGRVRQPRGQAVSVGSRESDDAARGEDDDARGYGVAREDDLPDGTPYEMLEEEAVPEPRKAGMNVIEEVRALRETNMEALKRDEMRRAKKIQIENSLLNKSRNLINLSEMLTKELLPSVMERMEVCVCPICTGNVLALALNTLPTKYVTTDEGKQYTQLEVYKRQNELDVIAALTRACVRVKDSPRHEIIDDLNE